MSTAIEASLPPAELHLSIQTTHHICAKTFLDETKPFESVDPSRYRILLEVEDETGCPYGLSEITFDMSAVLQWDTRAHFADDDILVGVREQLTLLLSINPDHIKDATAPWLATILMTVLAKHTVIAHDLDDGRAAIIGFLCALLVQYAMHTRDSIPPHLVCRGSYFKIVVDRVHPKGMIISERPLFGVHEESQSLRKRLN